MIRRRAETTWRSVRAASCLACKSDGGDVWKPQKRKYEAWEMISWRIELDGKVMGQEVAFDSFLQQAFLLPLIDVGGAEIDEYDGGQYAGDDLRRLRGVIRNQHGRIEPRAGQEIHVETWSEGSGPLSVDEILKVLDLLDSMAETALQEGAVIKFLGD